ncbi:MAG: response regulator [Holophagales bacterium]|nr:response regulator [Holophagales bacterium]
MANASSTKTIEFKIVASIVAVMAFIIVAGGAVGLLVMRKSIQNTIEANIKSSLEVAYQYVTKEIELQKQGAALVAKKIDLSLQTGMQQGALSRIFMEHPEYIGLAICDSNGLLISSVGSTPPPDLPKKSFVREALAGKKTISTTVHSSEGTLVMYVCTPISKGLALAAALPGAHFSHEVSNFKFYQTGHLIIADSGGHVISDRSPELVHKRFNYIKMAKTNTEYEKFSEIVKRGIDGQKGIDYFDLDGQSQICAFRNISGTTENWFIGIIAPLSESALGGVPKGLLLLALTMLGLSIIAAFPAAAYLKRPFEVLDTQTSVLKAVFDCSPNFIFCLDMDLRYIRMNKPMADVFNISEEDAIGKKDSEILPLPYEALMEIERINRQILEKKETHMVEEIVPDFWGRPYHLETVKSPLMKNGELIGILGIAHDITERKAIEEELVAASHSKSMFLARMSHELRTPLNVIIGLTDLMMEDDDLPITAKQNLATIGNAGDTLLNLVNDILDISKIDSGKLELVPVEYQTTSMINDTIVLLKTYIGEKPIDLKLHITKDMPTTLFGDELRIKQILNNLLSNAVKYTHKGMVELSINTERSGSDMWLDISVKDTGMGIREDDMSHLFSEYYKADLKLNRKTEGTGLGLSITKKLVELMDGTIKVESEYGKGSTFYIRIRQGFVNDETIGTMAVENLSSSSYSDAKRLMTRKLVRANLEHIRVLVVDDMQTNLIVTAGLMQKYKMKVDCVTSGQSAVDRISRQSPVYDAVFMDHMMPGMDGIEAANAIRTLGTDYAKNIPIIALTANAVLGSEAMFYANGFQDFLSKPVDIMRLDAVLNKWLVGKAHEGQAAPAQTSGPEALSLSANDIAVDAPNIPADSSSASIVTAAVVDAAVQDDPRIDVDIPGIDNERANYLYDGDMEIFLPVLRSYATHSLDYLEKLRNATEENLSECTIVAHGIKGASANICAESLRAVAAEMESSGRKGDFAKFMALRGPFLEDAAKFIDTINAWLENYDKNAARPMLDAPSIDVLKKLRQSCEAYDMSGIDSAMDELENSSYKNGGDLVEWLRAKIDTMEVGEVVARLSKEDPFSNSK